MASEATVVVDTSVYAIDVINRAAYALTGRCHIHIEKIDETAVKVTLRPLGAGALEEGVAAAFDNALIDQRVRGDLARETGTIRDLIFRQAFVEADL